MQRRGKYASRTIELLLETVFSTRSVQRDYNEDNWGKAVSWELSSEERLRRDGAIVQLFDIQQTIRT
jgi:hypothetical protein